ncbi:hypothetical protein BJP41_03625 [Candidatus Williamhamiltonella defendens]|uniref:Uncharacterized protein n=1 Tax=Candidatus Williamhamiltonella defendens TaxID=138072 RepID=A0A2D3T1C1_9ENTR|nr:hypothetical protein BJP41_03625 [Candidatus Hamiltonella defensa]
MTSNTLVYKLPFMKSIIVQVQRLNFAMQSKNFSQTNLEKASRVFHPTIFNCKLNKDASKGSKKL